MAVWRDFLVFSVFLHAAVVGATAVEAGAATESRAQASSEVRRVKAAARFGSSAAIQSDMQKESAHRRLRSHSSHGRRANVFRAASAARAGLQAEQVPAPIFVPKMGLANVTDPTPYPPPPPVLHPWKEMQPLDTAVGNYLISGLIAEPTVTPPPSQASLDLAFACPVLLTWPTEVTVSAPDPCGKENEGTWKAKDGSVMIDWSTTCIDTVSPGVTAPSTSPVTTYKMPNGDLFGTSQVVDTAFSESIELRDCGGATVFTVEEKIYKQAGKPDESACEKHKSCDGVIYFQYFIKDGGGNLVALSPYTTIFQDSFDITDPAGALIVQITRNGWEPDNHTPDCSAKPKPREWHLKYGSSPPGIWASAPAQWPIATMMTMLSQRDDKRQPDGSIMWSNCNVLKGTGYAVGSLLFFGCCICTPMMVFVLCSATILGYVRSGEELLFPRRMGKPSTYGN